VVEAEAVGLAGFGGAVVLDHQGHGVLRPLAVGSYRLSVRPAENDWNVRHDSVWSLSNGGTVPVVLELRIVEGRLRLNDAQGKAIPNADFGLAPEGAEWPSRTVRTNAEGDLQLKLSPGLYKLWRSDSNQFFGPETLAGSFGWASTGATSGVLVISK
jgi:hypothetical protein